MKKVRVMFNQLIAGALLKFGKLDSVDITLLMQGISSIAEVVNNDSERINEYFVMGNGSVILNDCYINKIYKKLNNTFLERMQGDFVKRYMDNLDIEEFVLRKIKLLNNGCVPKDDLIHTFSISQINTMVSLYEKGYIIDYWQEECIYDDYQAIELTKRGEVYLFLRDNKKKIDQFARLLRDNGYDEVLIQAFLITQDLERRPIDILTIDNFIAFCNEFDRCPYVSGDRKGCSRVRVPDNKIS